MDEIVVGALFDFMGRLTTLDEPITLGANTEPHHLLDVFSKWADERGLNTTKADVQGWHNRLQEASC